MQKSKWAVCVLELISHYFRNQDKDLNIEIRLERYPSFALGKKNVSGEECRHKIIKGVQKGYK